jgi:hypothetical protein
MWALALPGAERGTVNGMLPDFRFVLGAILAIAVLAVAGLGLMTSVQLVHEARMNPIENARSLAFAGHPEWNQFYEPEGARRFQGLAGKTEGPVAEAGLENAAETAGIAPPVVAPPMIAPPTIELLGTEERMASLPAHRLDPIIAPAIAPVMADDTPDTPATGPPPAVETPAAPAIAAPPGDAARTPAPDTTSVAPPAARVADAPATWPGPDHLEETQTPTREPTPAPAQPQAAKDPPQNAALPTPRARPQAPFRRAVARAHIRVAPVRQQPPQNSGFPGTYTPWPGYETQFTGATAKKNTGKPTGTLASRPQ